MPRGTDLPLAGVLALAGALLLPAPVLLAFPGSVRWGYANCATCHVNPAGGGLLTPYGRQLSRELLSTWGGPREAEFAYGALELPDWLLLGGDFTWLATGRAPNGAACLDQADLEAAATRGRWLALATVGRKVDLSATGRGWTSRRHYLQFTLSPQLSLRAGRYLPHYGVWNGDESTATRAGLGWDRDSSNVEANWIGPRFNAALTGLLTGADGEPAERGVSGTVGWLVGGRRKLWLSGVARGRPGRHRRAGGVAGVLGIGRHAYLLAQADLQWLREGGASRRQFFSNLCLARETVKGLYVLLVHEGFRDRLGTPASFSHSYGATLRWFARPHIELQLRWRHQDRRAISPAMLSGVSGLIHFYP